MAVIQMITWWYAEGWGIFAKKLGTKLADLADFFSLSSLLRTLFQPYRQISAGDTKAGASLEAKFQAFIDRLISRAVGFVSRFVLLIIGVLALIFTLVLGTVMIVIWPVIPFLPILGIVLTCTGVAL